MSGIQAHDATDCSAAQHIIIGQRDMTACEHIRQLFIGGRRALRSGAPSVVIDLHEVDEADTKLIACLVVLYQIARSGRTRLELCVSQAVLDVAEVCRLEWWVRRLASRPQLG